MAVNNEHEEYKRFSSIWQKCRDLIAGEEAVKARGEEYLPRPSGQSTAEYEGYKKRSVLFNATGRTGDGLSGLIFGLPPQVKVPTSMEELTKDFTLSGLSLLEIAEQVVEDQIAVGRIGLLVDYPRLPEGMTITAAIKEQLHLRPFVSVYKAESIVNWTVGDIDNQRVLTKVVLREVVAKPDPEDEFESEKVEQYRVLDLTAAQEGGAGRVYRQRLFQLATQGNTEVYVQIGADIIPRMNGKTIDFIPFKIIGVRDSEPDVEEPPILDLVNLNLAHYRNSADYENGLHYTGVPTPIFIGLMDDDAEVKLGSTDGIKLQVGGDAHYLEFTATGLTTLKDAMGNKEGQMAVLGARILSPERPQVETAEAASIHRAGENSVLADMANTASAALTEILEWMRDWAGATGEVAITLNTDYMPAKMDPQEAAEWLALLQASRISEREFFEAMQKGRWIRANKTFEEHKQEIEDDGPSLGITDPFERIAAAIEKRQQATGTGAQSSGEQTPAGQSAEGQQNAAGH